MEAAAGFLAGRTGDATSRPPGLAVELGGLPLALEQAAAYIQATGGSLAGYLALFQQRRADLLARGQPDRVRRDGGHHLGAGVRAAAAGAPGAAGLLRLLAFLRARGRSRCGCCCAPARAGRAAGPGGGAGAGAAAGR